MTMLPYYYMQSSRKNYESELQFKQNTSKQLFSDPEEIWELESVCEDLVTSGNESDPEDNIYDDFTELQDEILGGRRQFNPNQKKIYKNVRFESSNCNKVFESSDTSSVGNKYIDIDCRYAERRRSLTQEPEMVKIKDNLRGNFKQKWTTIDCYDKKYERRPKSSPEKSSSYLEKSSLGLGDYNEMLEQRHKTRKKGHKCGKCCGDVEIESEITRKFIPKCKHDFGDSCIRQKHFHCCDHYTKDEGRKKNYQKTRPIHKSIHGTHLKEQASENVSKTCKKGYRETRQPQDVHYETFTYNTYVDHNCQPDDFNDHTKTKKKVLEAVQEQQEQLSDATYKLPCAKLSSQTIPGETNGFIKTTKSSEKLSNLSHSDWKYCSGKNFEEKLYQPQKIHKLRSRRTRMNRLKNGWKKAFVQTVRDGTRNERVGVLVMGPKGPEFFSKNQIKPGVPFRKSKSFLEGEAKSFDAVNSVCQNVFPSSSEPGPQINYSTTEFACPEEDLKVEEKIAKFSKNFNDILKTSEEKFYKALSNNDFSENSKKHPENIYLGAGEGGKKDYQKSEKSETETKSKYPPFPLLPVKELSPRIPKIFKKPEMKINEESKAKADALNEKARQYKENQLNLRNKEDKFLNELKELQEKFPPKEINPENVDGNLGLWGMKLEQLSEETECSDEKKEQRNDDSNNTKQRNEINIVPKVINKEKIAKNETSPRTGSVKSNEQISINKQRRKKYFETKGMELKKDDDDDDDKGEDNFLTTNAQTKWTNDSEENKEMIDVVQKSDKNFISAVFQDLVENGCAISQEESENLQNVFNKITFNDDTASEFSSGPMNTTQENKINESLPDKDVESKRNNEKLRKENKCIENEIDEDKKNYKEKSESYREENSNRKMSKIKKFLDEKLERKGGTRTKPKKKILLEDKMKLLRQALPGIAAEKEETHLKQLKKYIDRFIERVEASTSSECRRKKYLQLKESHSTDSSEVKVDAKKILDIVSNPFERISSDVTINIAKKLTDALVQDKSRVSPRHRSCKSRNNYENEIYEEETHNCDATSGSDRHEEMEPTYLKQLKKMRNEHLNNIVMEVKRLSELLRFLDRCNRLTS